MIHRMKHQHPIGKLCQVFGVSRSGYYASRAAKAGVRMQQEVLIRKAILQSHNDAPSYGLDNIHADVREKIVCGRNRVRRLMRDMGVRSCRKRPYRMITTNSKHDYLVEPNRLKGLTIDHPNQVWVGDISYIHTDEGFLYLAIVKDKFTREIVGYSQGDKITSQLAQAALRKAYAKRKPSPGLIFHSDRGVQYCCHEYRKMLRVMGIISSMSKKGNPYDNAMAENFFCCIKCERLYLEKYARRHDAQLAIFSYIEGFYNTRRRHSALGYVSPQEFYLAYQAGQRAAETSQVVAGSRRQAQTQRKADGVSKTAAAARRGAESAL